MKLTVSVAVSDSTGDNVVVAELHRDGAVTAASLGLTLAEAKELLRGVQRQLVQAQLALHVETQRTCRACGTRRQVKERRRARFKSLFGGVPVSVARLRSCGCPDAASGAKTLIPEGLNRWVAPELEYVESWLAAKVSYARSSDLLTQLLPADVGSSTSTVRRRTLAVGKRLEKELRETKDAPAPGAEKDFATVVAAGLDSGYVRSCCPESGRSFEVVVGRILGRGGSSRSLGFVRTIEKSAQSRDRIRWRVAQEGATTDGLTVFTDGDEDLRRLQLAVLPNAEHILDWYHLTRKLTVLKNVVCGKEAVAKLPPHHQHNLYLGLSSLKWRLWHGQHARALSKVKELQRILRLPTVRNKPTARRLRPLLGKLFKFLKSNADSLPDYGKRYREGKRIATSFVESAVNQLVDKRMSKSQQMRWSRKGAHLLIQVRTEVVDGRLTSHFERWYPGFRGVDVALEVA